MAVGIWDQAGEYIEIFPSHDPDKLDAGLALELAVERTRDGVLAAARAICPNVDPVAGEEYIQALEDALATYDAAVAEYRAHDDRAVPVAMVCRECGCTDTDACVVRVEGQTVTCWWVEEDLCYGCAEPASKIEGPNSDHRNRAV